MLFDKKILFMERICENVKTKDQAPELYQLFQKGKLISKRQTAP